MIKKFFKLFFCLCLSILLNNSLFADATFLSDILFYDAYKNIEVIADAKKYGISEEEYLDFLFSNENGIGEKVALVSSLSMYFEWSSSEEETEYFTKYGKLYTEKLLHEYDTDIVDDEKIPAEYLLLYYLISDFDTTVPNLENYENIAKKLPTSLTAQTILLFSQAYYIIYNDSKSLENQRKIRNNYLKPYKDNFRNFEKDLRPRAVKETVEWVEEIFNCWAIEDLENLSCYCEFSDEESLEKCLKFVTDTIISKIENFEMYPKYYSSYEDIEDFREAILKNIELEKEYINSLSINDIDKTALLLFHLKQMMNMVNSFSEFTAVGSNIVWYSSMTPYVDNFGNEFSKREECVGIDRESAFSDESPFFETTCYKNYIRALKEDMNSKCKELGGESNLSLKKTQSNWIKLRKTYLNNLIGEWEMYISYNDKELLAARVAMLYYYLNTDKIPEIYSFLINQ